MSSAVTPDFAAALTRHGVGPLRRDTVTTIQVNVGKLCNQACHHCHVDAGPKRIEIMTRKTAERVVALIDRSPGAKVVDITGGAPELNPNFRFIVESARRAEKTVTVRCNLTVLFVPGMDWLPEFYRDNRVELICSLPCYTAENVKRQRGAGVFEKSIAALRMLNRLGFGRTGRALDLVYNPVGAFLPPIQAELENTYRTRLSEDFGVEFRHLYTIANMPIARFADQLHKTGAYSAYMGLLVNHFNPGAVSRLMCRNLLSVGWDGALYDCDFNQMLEMPLRLDGRPLTLDDIDDPDRLAGATIATGPHCFGCTAGAGSSCGGALV